MMKQLLTLLFLFITMALAAQQNINYKALLKDSGGNVLASQAVTVQFSILEGVAQTNVYQETHVTSTDANGLVILNIGTGTTTDTFSDIDWNVFNHSLNVHVDSGTGLVNLGTTPFQSVPYAKYAENISAGINDLTDAKVVSRSIYLGTGSGNLDNGSDNQNTAIGDDAMKNTSSGAQNVALGESTLLSNTTGERNAVVGQSAMRNNTSGNRNTVIGEDALYSNTTGSRNVAIGNRAGFSATDSEKLYIDNSDTTSPLIWGDFTDGSEKVQINGELEIVNKTVASEIQITTGAVNGHVLTSDVSGNASWQLPTGGGGADNDWTVAGDDMSSAPIGNVGIGTATPSEKLEVVGKIKSAELQLTTTPTDGHVLTSDAAGNATWQLPSGGGGADNDWTLNGDDMFSTPIGNVGIGTVATTAKLEVVGGEFTNVTLLSQNTKANGKATVTETTGVNGIAIEATSSGESGVGVQATVAGTSGTSIKGDATGDLGVGIHGTSLHQAGTAVKGELLATGAGTGYGGYFTIETNQGTAVYGETKGTSPNIRYAGQFIASGEFATGIFGQADGISGAGVTGHNINETSGDGVVGYTTGNVGAGVRGSASSSSLATNYGGHFTAGAQYGTGVLGHSGGDNGRGVEGTASGIQGRAVSGIASASAGSTNYGGYFEANGTTGYGVYAKVTGNAGRAVYGESVATGSSAGFGGYFMCEGDSGVGAYGTASGQFGRGMVGVVGGDFGIGVYGEATNTGNVTNYGGKFIANGRTGIGAEGIVDGFLATGLSGEASGDFGKGVFGTATGDSGIGVNGIALGGNSSKGVNGNSTNGIGVNGESFNGTGVVGFGAVAGGRFNSADGKGIIVGTTAPTNGIAVDAQSNSVGGTGIRGIAFESTGANYGVVGTSNSATGFDFFANGAGTDYGAVSSIRWKTNIEEIDDPLGKLQQIRGVYYDWDEAHGGSRDVGMIAEEVGVILPEIVSYEANGIDAIGMDYGKLTPLLVEVTKEQQKIIDNQNLRIQELEAKVSEKETAINNMNIRVEAIERVLEELE